jgi:hypothetical protein
MHLISFEHLKLKANNTYVSNKYVVCNMYNVFDCFRIILLNICFVVTL